MDSTIVLPSPGKGEGLFAAADLPKGSVLARMQTPMRMKRSEVDEYFAMHTHLPRDCIVYTPRSSLVFFDASFARDIPWYKINHSRSPNCAPRILNPSAPPRSQQVGWVTTRDVSNGEEICFCYDRASAEWS